MRSSIPEIFIQLRYQIIPSQPPCRSCLLLNCQQSNIQYSILGFFCVGLVNITRFSGTSCSASLNTSTSSFARACNAKKMQRLAISRWSSHFKSFPWPHEVFNWYESYGVCIQTSDFILDKNMIQLANRQMILELANLMCKMACANFPRLTLQTHSEIMTSTVDRTIITVGFSEFHTWFAGRKKVCMMPFLPVFPVCRSRQA